MANEVELTRSEFAENFLYLDGEPFSLDEYPFMRRIYDSDARKKVLKFSRQTGKSTTLANLMVTNSVMIPNFKSLYVSPSVDQTKIFSNDRVKPVIEKSPFMQKYLYDAKNTVQNVFNKELLNGSRLYLKYVYLNADRIRGLSTDQNVFDETQDIITDTIPVINETMTRSEYKWEIYSGTPKRSKGPLANKWFNSTMYEYAIRCEACNKWNVLDMENIGLNGLICDRCGSHISPYENKGQWVSTYPHKQRMPDMEGYRISALHFAEAPWIDWDKDIIYKMEHTSKALFHNETLAIEHDSGALPIKKEEIMAACNEDLELSEEPGPDSRGRPAIMGIDYGPVNSEKSHTVISIVQPRGNELQVVYAKKFMGKEADYSFIHEEIPRLMKKWNCQLLAADYGMGEAPNSEFRNRLGQQKVLAFQHLPTQKERIRWQPKMQAYTLNRNQAFINFFNKLKNKNLKLPSYQSFEEFAEQIQHIQKEYNEEKNTLKFVSKGPDDFVHATIFAMISAEIMFGVTSDTLS